MRGFFRKLLRFACEEDGPTAVEYAVLLALIVSVCMAAISVVGAKSSGTFSQVGDSMGTKPPPSPPPAPAKPKKPQKP